MRSLAGRSSRVDKPMVVGVIAVTVLTLLVVLVFSQTLTRLLAPGGETVRAVFSSTGQLAAGDAVRVDGVTVGEVKRVTLDRGGRSSTVEMEVLEDGQPLYADATAAVRWRTLLGGNFAIEIERGRPRAGELGERAIPLQRTTNQVELDEILTALRGEPQAGLKTMLDEVPKALRDTERPGAALHALAEAAPSLRAGVAAARGRYEGDVRRLVDTAARAVRALSAPTDPLRDVVAGAAVTMRVTAARRTELGDTVRLASRVLPRTRATLQELDATLELADPLLAELRRAAPDVAPAVAALRPTLIDADRLLRHARPVLRALRPAAEALRVAARDGLPVIDGLAPSLKRLDETILPKLNERDAVSKRTTYEMIGPTIAALGGAMAAFDAEANFFRFPASLRESTLDTAACRAVLTDPERDTLATCDSLVQAMHDLANYDPTKVNGTP